MNNGIKFIFHFKPIRAYLYKWTNISRNSDDKQFVGPRVYIYIISAEVFISQNDLIFIKTIPRVEVDWVSVSVFKYVSIQVTKFNIVSEIKSL